MLSGIVSLIRVVQGWLARITVTIRECVSEAAVVGREMEQGWGSGCAILCAKTVGGGTFGAHKRYNTSSHREKGNEVDFVTPPSSLECKKPCLINRE